MLYGHHQHEGSLPIRHGPPGGSDRRYSRTHPRYARGRHLSRLATDDLVDANPVHVHDSVAVPDRDVNRVVVEPRHAGVQKGGHSVEGRNGGARLPDGRPTSSHGSDRAGVDDHRLVADRPPATGVDLAPDMVVRDAEGAQRVA